MGQISKSTTQLDNIITYLEGITSGSEEGINIPTLNQIKCDKFVSNVLASLPAYKAGQISYDSDSLTNVSDTGITGVRVQIGQELHYLVYNDTGVQIDNGKPVYRTGIDGGTGLTTIALADSSATSTSLTTLGMTTHNIPDSSIGLITTFGVVRDFDTSSLSAGQSFYLGSTPGALTDTLPLHPDTIVFLGCVLESNATTGKVWVSLSFPKRTLANKSYSFTSNGIASGIYYIGGFYDAPAADTTLTQASLTQTYGTANNAYASHAFAVFGGAGTVDTGTVGLRVNGDSITDEGVMTPTDTETMTTDITTLSLNQYIETSKKWLGTVTYELYVTSGAPTTYSIDFNYGFAKYEDVGNRDFTVTNFEVVGLAGATDTNFDITLIHHKLTGWTYSATAFDPGNGVICDWSTDMSPYDNITNGMNFAYKRDNLNQFINGDTDEGVIVKINCGQNNSVQFLNAHLGGVVEGF